MYRGYSFLALQISGVSSRTVWEVCFYSDTISEKKHFLEPDTDVDLDSGPYFSNIACER